ncbi:MAG: DUF1573 domain-containing protein [Bacteroidota bacterium]
MRISNFLFASFLAALFLCALPAATQAQAMEKEKVSQKDPKPIMSFERRSHDFGKVTRGEKKETEFVFTNTGNAPLEIDIVSACDCTTTDYPIRPILPGQSGSIKVIFDSTEKEENEVIDIDIFLKNMDPETGLPFLPLAYWIKS